MEIYRKSMVNCFGRYGRWNMSREIEILDVSSVINKDEISKRVFQKLFLNGIELDNDFYKIFEDEDCNENVFKLKVRQLDENTRLVILGKILYKINSNNSLYNFLDEGRIVFRSGRSYYFLNENNIEIKEVKLITDFFNDYYNRQDWEEFSRKFRVICEISNTNTKIILVFKENIDEIKNYINYKKLKSEEKKEEEKREEEEEKKKERRKKKIFKEFLTLERIEDKDTIIEGNYFIDKQLGLKIEFDKKVKELFTKEELFTEYNNTHNENAFLLLDYKYFIEKLIDIYRIGKDETNIYEKVRKVENSIKKHLLCFKVYKYNVETKEEKFITKVNIENRIGKSKDYYFFINDIKMPKVKVKFALEFISNSYYGYGYNSYNDDDGNNAYRIINRLENIETSLKQIKYYSGFQLELLKGKTISIDYNGLEVNLNFEISNPDFEFDNWIVKFNNYQVVRNYTQVKDGLRNCYNGDIVSVIQQLSEELGDKIEDEVIAWVKTALDRRKQAEDKAKTLFLAFVEQNKARIIPKDDFYIVKGKLKNYKVAFKNDKDVGVWTYPNNNYICINAKDKRGYALVGYDKMLQFCLTLLNDSNIREEISTLR